MRHQVATAGKHVRGAFPIATLIFACVIVAGGYAMSLAADAAESRVAASQTGGGAIAPLPLPPAPRPAVRPPASAKSGTSAAASAADAARGGRLQRVTAVKSWGYQLAALSLTKAQSSPYDMLVVDATTGLDTGGPFTRADVERLKVMPDGRRRLVVSYLSIGEAEDYRDDYFAKEYFDEDAPDWLMKENPQWKGNRIIRFCDDGWQRTILGDDRGRNVYRPGEASPIYRLIELGFDGVYLDRVDVYAEVTKECKDSANAMVDFVARLAAHARKADPKFIVILQNAEELLANKKMVDTIDAVAKESLFYGGDMGQGQNPQTQVRDVLANLRRAQTAGRAVFVVDYVTDRGRAADAVRKISSEGFVPYVGPRNLAQLWLPGVHF